MGTHHGPDEHSPVEHNYEPSCSHGGDCRVPGHPVGPHGDMGEIQPPSSANLMQPGDWVQFRMPCPASILVAFGSGPVCCTEPLGHDQGPNRTNHKITIEWRIN